MKLATLKSGRDGELIVVSQNLRTAVKVLDIATTMQKALDNWQNVAGKLQDIYNQLNKENIQNSFPFDEFACTAPLPRAYQWLDGSAYLNHIELVRKARGAEMPPEFKHDPLMYQGISDKTLGPKDDAYLPSEEHGIDFEAEVVIITDDVPMGVAPEKAGTHIRLITLVNDVSLRNIIPKELAKGFGFMQSKPPCAFTAIAITPDELGQSWNNYTINLPLKVHLNNELFGQPNCGCDMNFNFAQLIAHAAKTRPLGSGTMIGSGTISNRDKNTGSCCIAEKRMIEIIENGKAETPFLKFNDRVKIEMLDINGNSIFGSIDHKMKQKMNIR